VVGATGSGKSELLRTIVAGLAASHPPDQLAFVLVDFKGGAAFAELTVRLSKGFDQRKRYRSRSSACCSSQASTSRRR
jgi:FtsK/SpoIIIE family